jgi:hypothetical protein
MFPAHVEFEAFVGSWASVGQILLLLIDAASVGTRCHLLLEALFVDEVLMAHVVVDLILELVLFLDVAAQVHALRDQTVIAKL